MQREKRIKILNKIFKNCGGNHKKCNVHHENMKKTKKRKWV